MPSPESTARDRDPAEFSLGIVTGSISRLAGGLFHSVRQSALQLNRAGIDVSVYAPSDSESAQDEGAWTPIKPHVFERGAPASLAYSRGMKEAVLAGGHDVLHLHGIWQYPSVIASDWRRKTGGPVMISPRGMLDPWALQHAGWKKRIVGWLFENDNLRHAHCMHALNESEAASMRAFGLTNPIAIIPNGTHIPDLDVRRARPDWLPEDGRKTLLFIGRIHQKKGIVELIEAWGMLRETHPELAANWRIAIAGWDDGGHLAEVERAITRTGLVSDEVVLPGPLHGDGKDNALAHADAFVLPSKSEGLPMSILEAWSWGLPTLMTQECNLPEGFDQKAALEIPQTAEELASKLAEHLASGHLAETGRNARILAEQRFGWASIASQHIAVYRWMLGKAAKPECVRLD
nr:glycosyltransferase [Aurantiacibacter sp. MUD61]